MTNPNKGTKGTKEICTKWPIPNGIGATDTEDGRIANLIAEKGSNVPCKEKEGI